MKVEGSSFGEAFNFAAGQGLGAAPCSARSGQGAPLPIPSGEGSSKSIFLPRILLSTAANGLKIQAAPVLKLGEKP